MKISTTASRLQEIMKTRNLRQVDILNAAKPFCKQLGIKLGKTDLSQYVNGKVEPGQEKISVLGLALNVSEAWLMGYDVSSSRDISYSSLEQIDLAVKGAKKWATDFRLSERQQTRITEFIAESVFQLKMIVNNLADADQRDGKIQINSTLQQSIDGLTHWIDNTVKFVNEDCKVDDDNPFTEEKIRTQFISAIPKLSVEDQYRWLVRIQDYIDEHPLEATAEGDNNEKPK